MQRGSADEIRSREGKQGADGRAASEGEGRGGTTDGDRGEGEETEGLVNTASDMPPLHFSVPPTPPLCYI